MRKSEIVNYIKQCQEELRRLESKGQRLSQENEKNSVLLYDLTDHYLREENLRGQIKAATYILNN